MNRVENERSFVRFFIFLTTVPTVKYLQGFLPFSSIKARAARTRNLQLLTLAVENGTE